MKKETDPDCDCVWCVNIAPLYNAIYEKLSGDVMSLTNRDLQTVKETLLKIEEFHVADYENVENLIVLSTNRMYCGNN